MSGPEAPVSIVERAKAIISAPAKEWARITEEETTSRDVFVGYVLPRAAIGPLSGFIGGQLFGYGAFGIAGKPPLLSSLLGAVVGFALSLMTYFILTLVADSLSPKFGGRHDMMRSAKLIAYASTPVWLCGIFALVPALGVLSVLGLYSIYLTRTGASPMMGVPEERGVGYTVAVVLCGLLVNIAVLALSATNMTLIQSMGLTN